MNGVHYEQHNGLATGSCHAWMESGWDEKESELEQNFIWMPYKRRMGCKVAIGS